MTQTGIVHVADARNLSMLPDESVHCVVCSPPYMNLRAYQAGEGEIGREATVKEYVNALVTVFREIRRVLRRDGVVWLNLGDSYGRGTRVLNPNDAKRDETGFQQRISQTGNYGDAQAVLPQKQLMGVPWRVALAMQDDGWFLRADCVWNKANSMPSSVEDRVTINHEYVFMLTKEPHYWYDFVAILEPLKEVSIKRQMRGRGTTKYNTNDYGQTHHSTLKARQKRDFVDMDALLQAGELGLHPGGRNKRSVWTVATSPSAYDFCANCGSLFIGTERKPLRHVVTDERGNEHTEMLPCPCCGELAWFAHFAPYPRKLIEPAILAACPPHVCADCGTPYVRVTEKQSRRESGSQTRVSCLSTKHDQATGRTNGNHAYADPLHEKAVREITTVGWRKACSCACTETLPGIVLDPFMGSGTTAMTAEVNHRRWIGIDLNPNCERLTLARIKRLNDDPQFRTKKKRAPKPAPKPKTAEQASFL